MQPPPARAPCRAYAQLLTEKLQERGSALEPLPLDAVAECRKAVLAEGVPPVAAPPAFLVWEAPPNLGRVAKAAKPGFSEARYRDFRAFSTRIAAAAFSAESGWAYASLRRATRYHQFGKRDGGLVVRATHEGSLLEGPGLEKALISHFQALHSSAQAHDPGDFPDLGTGLNLEEMAWRVNKGKALAWDCIGDDLFVTAQSCCRASAECEICPARRKVWQLFLRPEYWAQPASAGHFSARLVCLNKKFPATPKLAEHRPLVIASPVIKFLEGAVLPELERYAAMRMNRAQFAFHKGSGIDLCKREALREAVGRTRSGETTYALFIDFSSAYDRVDRHLLYSALQDRGILTPRSLQLTRFILSNLKVRMGNYEVPVSNGVPQGLLTSPMLFNIFAEPVLEDLQALPGYCKAYMYADDLLVLADSPEQLSRCLAAVRAWAARSNMLLNESKSGVMVINPGCCDPVASRKDVDGVPVVKAYKYLGTTLTGACRLMPHFEAILPKLRYLRFRLASQAHASHSRFMVNLFRLVAHPLLRLVAPLWDLVPQSERETYSRRARLELKLFLKIPRNTANLTVTGLAGDFAVEMQNEALTTDVKLEARSRFSAPDPRLLAEATKDPGRKWAKIPHSTLTALRASYGTRCAGHKTPLTTAHLVEAHGQAGGVRELLDLYQPVPEAEKSENKRRCDQARRGLRRLISLCNSLKTATCGA